MLEVCKKSSKTGTMFSSSTVKPTMTLKTQVFISLAETSSIRQLPQSQWIKTYRRVREIAPTRSVTTVHCPARSRLLFHTVGHVGANVAKFLQFCRLLICLNNIYNQRHFSKKIGPGTHIYPKFGRRRRVLFITMRGKKRSGTPFRLAFY
jgi:hypothetical protein